MTVRRLLDMMSDGDGDIYIPAGEESGRGAFTACSRLASCSEMLGLLRLELSAIFEVFSVRVRNRNKNDHAAAR